MSFKKLVAWLVCAVLLLSLVACAGGKQQDTTSEDVTTTNEQDTQENDSGNEDVAAEEETGEEETAQEESKATPEMDFDLGGRTIKVVAWWDMSITGEDPASVAKKENLEYLMEKHNFNIEYEAIDYGEYHDRLISSLMADQPLGDIVRIGKSFMIPSLTKQDLFWPIEE